MSPLQGRGLNGEPVLIGASPYPKIYCPFRAVVAINIPAGQWHTVKALESGIVIIEMKNGPYEPLGAEDVLMVNGEWLMVHGSRFKVQGQELEN